MRTNANTPWGTADGVTTYAPGLVFYTTPSHGGFHVSGALLARIPDYLQNADKYADGAAGWFEEDCAACIVIVCFPEFFTDSQRESAIPVMQSVYPQQWARFKQTASARVSALKQHGYDPRYDRESHADELPERDYYEGDSPDC